MQLVDNDLRQPRQALRQADDASTFELAPVSLWLEDLSGVKELLDRWSDAGMASVHEHLTDNRDRLDAVRAAIRVIKVNRKTLRLFEAESIEHLVRALDRAIRPESVATMVDEIAELWSGNREFFSKTVNYTLTGRRLDLQLRGNILPGHEESWGRVLVAVEDVSDLQTTRREMARSEAYARGLFEHSPVSLWVSDFSGAKRLLDELRGTGITDFSAFIAEHPGFVARCLDAIRLLDVNRQTLKLYGVPNKAALWGRHVDLLHSNLDRDLREQLIGLWNGEIFQERETTNTRLDGSEVHVHLQFSVLPGHEDDWSLVQVARTDVSARRAAEAHLEYLRDHDSLTQLHSRCFYSEELKRLSPASAGRTTIIVVDVNGLKAVNDRYGHAAGDALLQSAASVLSQRCIAPWTVARIGGDEFVILMPGASEQQAAALMAEIQAHAGALARRETDPPLSLSLGAATQLPGEPIEATVSRADHRMYEAKRLHYSTNPEGSAWHSRAEPPRQRT